MTPGPPGRKFAPAQQDIAQAEAYKPPSPWGQILSGGGSMLGSYSGPNASPNGALMSTFGFYPGPIDYWMLITDWRNGSIAIMLAIGAFVVGYAFRTGSSVVPSPPAPRK
jgi:hypothetical protein